MRAASESFEAIVSAIAGVPPKQRPAAKDAARSVAQNATPRLSASARALFDAILQRLIWKDGSCKASWRDLAMETRFDRRQIIRAAEALERAGLIVIRPSRRPNGLCDVNAFAVPALVTGVSLSGVADVTIPGDRDVTRGSDTGVTEIRTLEVTLEETRVASGPSGTSASEDKHTQPANDGFDAFWREYPRRVAKHAAAGAFDRLSSDERTHAIAGAKALAREVKKNRTEDRFIAYAATFLNQRRFEDYPPPYRGAPQGTDSATHSALDQDIQVKSARRFFRTGAWDRELGPPPGEDDCTLPASVIREAQEAMEAERARLHSGGHADRLN